MLFKFENGDLLKDSINKFEGVVVSRIEYINGCIRYEIKPTKLKDGKSIETEFVDEAQLILVKKGNKKKAKPLEGSRIKPNSNLSKKSF